MTDTSTYSIEERLVASVWVHERPFTGKTMSEILDLFEERFQKVPPRKATLLDWEKRAFELGSVMDRPRSGRRISREETCASVAASVDRSPQKSTRKRAAELRVPRSTMRDHMKKDLHLKAFRPMVTNELLDADLDRRKTACRALLDTFPDEESRSNVLFCDECAIYRSSRDRNVVFWAKENPHFTMTLEHNPPHVMLWAGLTSNALLGPYFFTGSVNAETYSDMLEKWVVPQLRDRGLLENVWLQHDGAPAHFALSVRNVLNQHFPGRWIGRGSPASPAPLTWPPRSPDLTTPDNSLWGIIKGQVSARRYNNNEDLQKAVEEAFQTITPEILQRMSERTWRRIRLCYDHNGEHTDPLDL